jgi:hypothetical protein
MSIQALINISETLEFNRRKVISQQVSRSGIVKVTESVTRQPWQMTANVAALLKYEDARDLMETMDYYDRLNYQDITFKDNFSWMWAYRGDLSANQRSALTVSSFVGTTLTLTVTGLTNVGQGAYLFKKNDVLAFGTTPYAFTVVNDVQRGSGNTVAVTLHRPNFTTASLVGSTLSTGTDVKFRMIAKSMPTYRLIPGRLVEITGPLELVEFTGEVG